MPKPADNRLTVIGILVAVAIGAVVLVNWDRESPTERRLREVRANVAELSEILATGRITDEQRLRYGIPKERVSPSPEAPPPAVEPWAAEGSGDDIVAVPRRVSRLRIEAEGYGHFSIWCTDSAGDRADLVVNTAVRSDTPYAGVRRLRGCAELDITADGVRWSMAVP